MTEIDVVYEKGVFKILSDITLKEGTKGKVIIQPSQMRKYRLKVDTDVMLEFLEKRKG